MDPSITIGRTKICVEVYDACEDASGWISAHANITITEERGGCDYTRYASVDVGCWRETDDDHVEWSRSHEGERVIGTVLGTKCNQNGPISFALGVECDTLGRDVCAAIRKCAMPKV